MKPIQRDMEIQETKCLYLDVIVWFFRYFLYWTWQFSEKIPALLPSFLPRGNLSWVSVTYD